MKDDVYKIVRDFFEEGFLPKVTNSSFIVLIPKVDISCKVTDFVLLV